MEQPIIEIDYLGGNCPVQAEGTIDGQPFYFRARGDSWSLGIGGDPVGAPAWERDEVYGVWPDAGWMSEQEAMAFIEAAAMVWKGETFIASIQEARAASLPSEPKMLTPYEWVRALSAGLARD